jgi:hypothetical protein
MPQYCLFSEGLLLHQVSNLYHFINLWCLFLFAGKSFGIATLGEGRMLEMLTELYVFMYLLDDGVSGF